MVIDSQKQAQQQQRAAVQGASSSTRHSAGARAPCGPPHTAVGLRLTVRRAGSGQEGEELLRFVEQNTELVVQPTFTIYAFDELVETGEVYSTVDEFHFAAMEVDMDTGWAPEGAA